MSEVDQQSIDFESNPIPFERFCPTDTQDIFKDATSFQVNIAAIEQRLHRVDEEVIHVANNQPVSGIAMRALTDINRYVSTLTNGERVIEAAYYFKFLTIAAVKEHEGGRPLAREAMSVLAANTVRHIGGLTIVASLTPEFRATSGSAVGMTLDQRSALIASIFDDESISTMPEDELPDHFSNVAKGLNLLAHQSMHEERAKGLLVLSRALTESTKDQLGFLSSYIHGASFDRGAHKPKKAPAKQVEHTEVVAAVDDSKIEEHISKLGIKPLKSKEIREFMPDIASILNSGGTALLGNDKELFFSGFGIGAAFAAGLLKRIATCNENNINEFGQHISSWLKKAEELLQDTTLSQEAKVMLSRQITTIKGCFSQEFFHVITLNPRTTTSTRQVMSLLGRLRANLAA